MTRSGAGTQHNKLMKFMITGPNVATSNPLIQWEVSSTIAQYAVALSVDSECVAIIENVAGLTSNSYQFRRIEFGTYYVCLTSSVGDFALNAENNGREIQVVDSEIQPIASR